MQRKTFDVGYWLNMDPVKKEQNPITEKTKKITGSDKKFTEKNIETGLFESVKRVVDEIERQKIDITNNYTDWCNIGFALTDAFGYEGLDLYRRISKFNPKYNIMDCELQYLRCMKSGKEGITIGTFFHLAKQFNLFKTEDLDTHINSPADLPTIPEEVFGSLPKIVTQVCEAAKSETERDILLIGAIVTFSSCLPNVFGIYDRRKVFPNLYLFVTAKASAGKGVLNQCRNLVKRIHEDLRKETKQSQMDYREEMKKFKTEKKNNPELPKPAYPKEKMLFIPANNSATGMFQLLDDNDGKGLMFETEGDTLSNTFKSDYGNYSDGFRKAFHHEEIAYYRRTDREHVEIESPRLSTVLSGTPNQVNNLIPDSENGLFSRFIFYHLNIKTEWYDVFESNYDDGMTERFTRMGDSFYDLYQRMYKSETIQFRFTKEQSVRFNKYFRTKQEESIECIGENFTATIRRLGVIAYRIAMVFSVLRIEPETPKTSYLLCSNQDFDNTLMIIETLVKHSEHVYFTVQQSSKKQQIPVKKKENFYNRLPNTFSRKDYAATASTMSIPDKTAQRYIREFIDQGMVERQQHGIYSKLFPRSEDLRI